MDDEMPVYEARAKHASRLTMVAFVLLFAVVAGLAHAKATGNPRQGGRDEVRLELSGNGFTPAEFQHGPGTFAIAVENKILSGEYTLKLKAEDGTVLNEFQIQKGSSAWTVNLPTGRYELTEVNHPQWTCRIVVQ